MFRRSRLSYDATLLTILLREELRRFEEEEVHNQRCVISGDDLFEQWKSFFPRDYDEVKLRKQLNAAISELKNQQQIAKSPEFGFHSLIAKSEGEEKCVEVDLGHEVAVTEIVVNPCHDDFAGIGSGFGFPVRFRVEVEAGGQWQTLMDFTDQDFPNPGLAPVKIEVPAGKPKRISGWPVDVI